MDDGVGPSVCDRQCQCARARAQIENHRRVVVDVFEERQSPGQQQFGFRSGHEHARSYFDVDVAQRRGSRDVLQRNAFRALLDGSEVRLDELGFHERHQTETAAIDSDEVCGEQLRIDSWARHTGSIEHRCCFEDGQT